MSLATFRFDSSLILGCVVFALSASAGDANGLQCSSPQQTQILSLDDLTAQANPNPQDCGPPPKMNAGMETIVLVRHGEKTRQELGQLCCAGQNRALLLPKIFASKFGTPNYLYAPNPSVQIAAGSVRYSYVRPLATIEPTAIELGMPVNTQIGYSDVCTLQNTLVTAANSNSKIFVAWEHININQFASNILKTYNVTQNVPEWGNGDYDRIYVFTIATPSDGSASTLTFVEDHEGLNDSLAPQCATAPPWPIEYGKSAR